MKPRNRNKHVWKGKSRPDVLKRASCSDQHLNHNINSKRGEYKHVRGNSGRLKCAPSEIVTISRGDGAHAINRDDHAQESDGRSLDEYPPDPLFDGEDSSDDSTYSDEFDSG